MPELLALESADWRLVVWSKDIAPAQEKLTRTLQARKKPTPATRLRFAPSLYLSDLDRQESEYIPATEPLFFENKLYEFDFQFHHDVEKPLIKHRLALVEDAFHCSGKSFRGSINFGNDVGWFKLVLNYQLNGKNITQAISFEVFPTKMDLETDLATIQQEIDQQYPLLRFSFAQKTEQELAQSRKLHERFPLLWLAQFERLRIELEKGIKLIVHAPHARLLPQTRTLRAEQLKGRLSPRLEQRVKSDLIHNNTQQRYKIGSHQLSLNTPENRFVKMVLTRCVREISAFIVHLKDQDTGDEGGRLSATFFEQLNQWKTPLESYLARPFFKEIGDYDGANNESLVLHHKAGYAPVYRIWQQLKLYLDVFGHHASISMKSIAELYEVWCVLEVRRLLIEELGFKETSSRKAALDKKGVERTLKRGMGVAFNLERDKIKIRLAHEPLFKRSKDPKLGHIYSWITSQKPDILLEAEFEGGEKLHWIFDAKYRIETGDKDIDYAPDDAINQMHRYRDALIHIHQADDGEQEKTRPIFGAFVLYPGWFEDNGSENPYQQAIKEVGIGAFPLLPNSNNPWLRDFLVEQFGLVNDKAVEYKLHSPDHFYVQEAARIPYTGMKLSRFQNLVLTIALGKNRRKTYLDKFRDGSAKWYHLPESTTMSKKVAREVMRELKLCAFVVYSADISQRKIKYRYEIRSVRLLKRKDITEEQSGAKADPKKMEEHYWLFELGASTKLNLSIDVSGSRDFKFRLTSLKDLETATAWNKLPNHYNFLQKA